MNKEEQKDINKYMMNELLEDVEHSVNILSVNIEDKFWQGVLFGKLAIVEDVMFFFIRNDIEKEYEEYLDRWEVANKFLEKAVNE